MLQEALLLVPDITCHCLPAAMCTQRKVTVEEHWPFAGRLMLGGQENATAFSAPIAVSVSVFLICPLGRGSRGPGCAAHLRGVRVQPAQVRGRDLLALGGGRLVQQQLAREAQERRPVRVARQEGVPAKYTSHSAWNLCISGCCSMPPGCLLGCLCTGPRLDADCGPWNKCICDCHSMPPGCSPNASAQGPCWMPTVDHHAPCSELLVRAQRVRRRQAAQGLQPSRRHAQQHACLLARALRDAREEPAHLQGGKDYI